MVFIISQINILCLHFSGGILYNITLFLNIRGQVYFKICRKILIKRNNKKYTFTPLQKCNMHSKHRLLIDCNGVFSESGELQRIFHGVHI